MNSKMRQRSKSVFVSKSEKEPFEDNHNSENDETSNDDEDSSASSSNNDSFLQNVTIKTEKNNDYTFSSDETVKMIKQIKSQIPNDDTNRYNNRFEKIKWEQIKIAGRTTEEMKRFFKSLVVKARCYRLLGEVISDIEVSLENSEIVVAKPTPPLTPLMLYSNDNLNRVKEENPGVKNQKIHEILSKEFNELPVKKLDKILKIHLELNNQYEKQLKMYYKQYPKELPKARKPKKKPVSPFELFIVDKREEGSTLSKIELFNEWKNLTMEEKIPYIRKSFSYQQTEKDSKYITAKEVDSIKEYYGKPKNFISPFSFFCSENGNTIKEGMQFGDRSKLLGKLWKELDPKEKEKLISRYNQYRKKYEVLYSEYLNRLPIELVTLAENLIALPDTPYNLFLKSVRSKNPTANVREDWNNLSRTKRVKWIIKSFEIQESANEANYKKLVSNEEMAIIYKTLGKPSPHQNVYTMFKATLPDKSLSEGEEHSLSWKNLPKKDKNIHKQNFIDHRNDFKEQFAQYLLRLPEACRKSEIFTSKIITDFEKNDIFLMMNKLSGKNDNSMIIDEIKDKKRKKQEEESDEDDQTSPPPKKVKKTNKLDSSKSKSFEKTTKQLRKQSLMSSEDELENKNKSGKKTKIQTDEFADEDEITSSKRSKNINKSVEVKEEEETVEEAEEITSPKKTKKSRKNKTVEEEDNQSQVDESVKEEEIKTSKKGKKSKKDESVKEEQIETPTKAKRDKKDKKEVLSKKKKVEEPVVPPKSAYNYYKVKVYRGKPENIKASWTKLPAAKKENIQKLHSDLNNKYLSQLKEYLRSLSETEVLEYSRKKMESAVPSDDDDDDDDDDVSSSEDEPSDDSV